MITILELHASLSRHLVPAEVDRIVAQASAPDRPFFRNNADVHDWISIQIEQTRKESVHILECDVQEKAQCQVCKTEVTVKTAKSCARCQTPYHQDCYDFARGCAIFGCGSKS